NLILTTNKSTYSGLEWKNSLNLIGSVEASSFKKTNGTSSQFLKADGTVDTNTYLTSAPSAGSADGQIQYRSGTGFGASPGLTFTSSTNVLSCSGDIIAFASDERLKTNIKPIQNAVDKVLKLRGFTYNFNEIGERLGFNTSLIHSGVSAQEVQAVLPEAVCAAPASDEYLTVKYDKLVPLLIEAIKELSTKVEDLEKKLKSI
ncbi:MAG: tail fiber domain-containing protein, partial [Proteobacteria bacterium]|nr:tail fiber domain-containing protein [Pseudomonadota bacterium]